MNFRLGWGPKIALQFATVMLPLAVLLFVQAWLDFRRSDRLAEAFPLHLHANAALKSYKQFVDGVTDAVDSGKLPAHAIEALHESAESLHQIAESPAAATRSRWMPISPSWPASLGPARPSRC